MPYSGAVAILELMMLKLSTQKLLLQDWNVMFFHDLAQGATAKLGVGARNQIQAPSWSKSLMPRGGTTPTCISWYPERKQYHYVNNVNKSMAEPMADLWHIYKIDSDIQDD
jgi:hypothetical protein